VSRSVEISARFAGPPRSANGGYACGVVASAFDAAAVEVTLRAPPPLDTAMTLEPRRDGVALMLGDRLVAEGVGAELELELLDPIGVDLAAEATAGYRGAVDHLFPGCFVCGPAREPGDGLRVFPGPCSDRAVAAPWTPAEPIAAEIVWSVLDCPTYFGAMTARAELARALLGRMTARIWRLPEVGEPCVVMGWDRGGAGRKILAASALYSAAGEPLAAASATWIEVDELPV
jgi:hypothetical protein